MSNLKMNDKKDLEQPLQFIGLENLSDGDTLSAGMVCDIETGICSIPDTESAASKNNVDNKTEEA